MTATRRYSAATQCGAKRAYRAKSEAKAAALHTMSARDSHDRRPAVVYRCPHCTLWHVGHPVEVA